MGSSRHPDETQQSHGRDDSFSLPAPAMPVDVDPFTYTFEVVSALSGEHLATTKLPITPAPTVATVKADLARQGIVGQLVLGSRKLRDDDGVVGKTVLDLEPGGKIVLGLIKGAHIEVKEAGLYNGVYEQIGENEGRPAFKLVTPDSEKSGERYIYYTSINTDAGWKFNKWYEPHYGRWDMLSPCGPATLGAKAMNDDIPEGKYQLYNGGAEVKANAPLVSKIVISKTQEEIATLARVAVVQEQENIDTIEYGGCCVGDPSFFTTTSRKPIDVEDCFASACHDGLKDMLHMPSIKFGADILQQTVAHAANAEHEVCFHDICHKQVCGQTDAFDASIQGMDRIRSALPSERWLPSTAGGPSYVGYFSEDEED